MLGADGTVLDATTTLRDRPLLTPAQARRAARATYTMTVPGAPGLDEPARLLATPVTVDGRPGAFVLGVTEGNRIETLDRVRRQLWVGVPLLALLTTLGGYVLMGVALRPVERMRARASTISTLAPGLRLPVPPGRDEFARLGETLNDLLARLEASSQRQRLFVANASHELRTPLAMMALELELAVRRDRDADELAASIRSARVEVRRLSTLAENLLLLSTTEEDALASDEVDVAVLLTSVAGRFAEAAAATGRRVTVSGPPPTGLRVRGDAVRLERAMTNLVANAVEHGVGDVELSVEPAEADVTITVRDTEGVLDPAVAGRAFDRFTRGSATGRSGLGLPIVAAIAAAHGGTAGIAAKPGGGVSAWLRLPRESRLGSNA